MNLTKIYNKSLLFELYKANRKIKERETTAMPSHAAQRLFHVPITYSIG